MVAKLSIRFNHHWTVSLRCASWLLSSLRLADDVTSYKLSAATGCNKTKCNMPIRHSPILLNMSLCKNTKQVHLKNNHKTNLFYQHWAHVLCIVVHILQFRTLLKLCLNSAAVKLTINNSWSISHSTCNSKWWCFINRSNKSSETLVLVRVELVLSIIWIQ